MKNKNSKISKNIVSRLRSLYAETLLYLPRDHVCSGLPITLNPSGAASDTIAVYEFLGNWGALSFKSRTSTVTVAVDDKRPAGSLASTRSRNFRSLAFS